MIYFLETVVPKRSSNQFRPQYFLEIGYKQHEKDTISYSLTKNKHYLTTITWIPKIKKKSHLKYVYDGKIISIQNIVSTIIPTFGNYIDVLYISSDRYIWILDRSLLKHIRFGVIIFPKDTSHTRRKLLDKCRYQSRSIPSQSNQLSCFVSIDGFAPYYRGSTIYQKYVLKRNFKSGLGSHGVYLLKNKTTQIKYVLKFATNQQEFDNEVQALQLTSDWPHSPHLVLIDKPHLALITEWCGFELRSLPNSKRDRFRPTIQKLLIDLYDRYQIYHNDIRWKNIVVYQNHIYLIDWGQSNKESLDKDPQHLLPDSWNVGSNHF